DRRTRRRRDGLLGLRREEGRALRVRRRGSEEVPGRLGLRCLPRALAFGCGAFLTGDGIVRRLAEEPAHRRLRERGRKPDQRSGHRLPDGALDLRPHLDLTDLLADRFAEPVALLLLQTIDATAEALDHRVDVR